MTTENALQYSYKSMSSWQGSKGTEMPVLHCTQKQKVVAVQCKAQGCYMKMMTKGFFYASPVSQLLCSLEICVAINGLPPDEYVLRTLFTKLPEQTGEPTHWCKALMCPCCMCVHQHCCLCVLYYCRWRSCQLTTWGLDIVSICCAFLFVGFLDCNIANPIIVCNAGSSSLKTMHVLSTLVDQSLDLSHCWCTVPNQEVPHSNWNMT